MKKAVLIALKTNTVARVKLLKTKGAKSRKPLSHYSSGDLMSLAKHYGTPLASFESFYMIQVEFGEHV